MLSCNMFSPEMHSSKGETSVTNDNQSESSVSTPSASFEPNDVCENTESRNTELCETPAASDTKSDTATGTGRAFLTSYLRTWFNLTVASQTDNSKSFKWGYTLINATKHGA